MGAVGSGHDGSTTAMTLRVLQQEPHLPGGRTRPLRSEPPCSSLRSLPSASWRRRPWRLFLLFAGRDNNFRGHPWPSLHSAILGQQRWRFSSCPGSRKETGLPRKSGQALMFAWLPKCARMRTGTGRIEPGTCFRIVHPAQVGINRPLLAPCREQTVEITLCP